MYIWSAGSNTGVVPHWPFEQTVSGWQTRSVEYVASTSTYCVLLHTVVFWQTRLEVTVGAADWNWLAAHVVTAVQLPFTSGLNVCESKQDVQDRSEDTVAADTCWVPAEQLLTGVQATLLPVFLNVLPRTHELHTRSVDSVAAVVWPMPTPQYCVLWQVELTVGLYVTPKMQDWQTQLDTAEAAATG